jgi:hypothetical protein
MVLQDRIERHVSPSMSSGVIRHASEVRRRCSVQKRRKAARFGGHSGNRRLYESFGGLLKLDFGRYAFGLPIFGGPVGLAFRAG